MNQAELRQALVDAAIAAQREGLNRGSSGNLSVRCGTGFLITPSGMSATEQKADDMVWMDMDGNARFPHPCPPPVPARGIPAESGSKAARSGETGEGDEGSLREFPVNSQRKPSSEWRFHRDLYAARPEFGAVLHAHATFATTLACLGRDIPPFHYMIAAAGGKTIRCAPYATFGTLELSGHALAAMAGRKACLLANHGLLVAESSLERALALAVEVETLCEQYCRALQIGTPNLLSDAEMDVVLEKFKSYGQNVQR